MSNATCIAKLLHDAVHIDGEPRKIQPRPWRPNRHGGCFHGMALGLILGFFVVFIVAYGFWMAAQLGVGPRWRRPRRDPLSAPVADGAREQQFSRG